MATLVLTAVGTAIGGPLGGAIGALLGQAVDARLLAPKAREGPRLTELAVQTSSYGTQIPKLFGTMRVAGTVIWATDLKETRGSQGGGKGQPKVNAYSYSASFAVALSGRPIVGVRRIWAEGKLLRGAGGDWKTRTGFRLHLGDEGQAPDPLIASVERVTPAHRGVAYAVFEDLQLADFGNRIPSLTFEVVADAGPDADGVAASAVAGELADEVEGTCALMLGGFAASGGSVGAVLDTLGMASGAWFGVRGSRVTMRDAGGEPLVVEDAGVRGTDAKPVRRGRSIAAADTVPAVVSVAHYDPARDYQTGVQVARRPGAGRAQRVEVPAVVPANVARGIAERVLVRTDAARVRRTVATGLGALAIGPGDTVRIAGETGSWRVADAMLEDMVVRLVLVPLAPATPVQKASAGRVLGAGDALVGRTVVHAFETPALDGAVLDRPRLTIATAGSAAGWRQAGLLYSVDDGGSWVEAGGSAAPAVLGTVVVPPAPASCAVIDAAGTIVVALAHSGMVLGDADDAALDAGVNLAIVGDELVQFGRAEPLGDARWRLSRLLRGRRGTEGSTHGSGHVAGERFVLLETDACRVIDLPPGARGMRVRVLASGVGDTGPATTETVVRGVSVLPLSPVQLRAVVAADGSARVTWVRRSRGGWAWIDGVDVPLGEEVESYRVVVTRGDGGVRIAVVGEPVLVVGADERASGPVVVAVSMLGTNGESAAVTLRI